jgi:hypothetical protein
MIDYPLAKKHGTALSHVTLIVFSHSAGLLNSGPGILKLKRPQQQTPFFKKSAKAVARPS